MAEDPALWNDTQKAQTVMKERTRLDGQITKIRHIETTLNDNVELIAMGEEEGEDHERCS